MPDIFTIHGEAARTAGEVDAVFIFILAIVLFFFFLTQGFLIYFAFRYRRKRGEEVETPYITGSKILELLWVVIPSLLILAIFVVGYVVFFDIRRPLPGAMEINVVARQWLWEFGYRDGRKVINELRIPVNRPIKLVMTSADVIHSLYIPDYRIKEDVLPGRYTYLWLEPKKTGRFTIFCAEYCGVGHSTMLATLVVMPQEEFDRWSTAKIEERKEEPLVERGEELLERLGCIACHSLDGSPKVGPTFKGLYGRKVELADGTTLTADDNYIRESILEPNSRVVKGFPPVMPTFKGSVSNDDLPAIIVYLKTVK